MVTEWIRLEEQKRGIQKDFQVSGLSYLLGGGIYSFREIRKIGRVADFNYFICSFIRHTFIKAPLYAMNRQVNE